MPVVEYKCVHQDGRIYTWDDAHGKWCDKNGIDRSYLFDGWTYVGIEGRTDAYGKRYLVRDTGNGKCAKSKGKGKGNCKGLSGKDQVRVQDIDRTSSEQATKDEGDEDTKATKNNTKENDNEQYLELPEQCARTWDHQNKIQGRVQVPDRTSSEQVMKDEGDAGHAADDDHIINEDSNEGDWEPARKATSSDDKNNIQNKHAEVDV
jgi:hypothetical protein